MRRGGTCESWPHGLPYLGGLTGCHTWVASQAAILGRCRHNSVAIAMVWGFAGATLTAQVRGAQCEAGVEEIVHFIDEEMQVGLISIS